MTPATTGEVHLVLGSGGVRTIGYVGALRLAMDRGISFASVSTCSAGTLIGALVCAGVPLERIEEYVVETDLRVLRGRRALPWPLGSVRALLRWPFARFREPGVVRVFADLAGGDVRLGDLGIPFSTAGVDIAGDRILVYSSETHPEMLVTDVLRIATAIPFTYPPHRSHGRVVIDAAFVSHCPIWLTRGASDDRPILALRTREPWRGAHYGNVFEYIVDSFVSAILSRDDYATRLPRVRLVEIECGDIGFDEFGLSRERREELVARGRAAARERLDSLGDDLWDVRSPPVATDRGDDADDRAEELAAELITGFQRRLPGMLRDQVFVSYCHEDREWLRRLQTHLVPFTQSRSFVVWDDRRIRTGDRWKDEIRRALAASRVAVLLVSPDFLASEFIAKEELPYIAWAAEQEGVRIVWVAVRASAYAETPLAELQSANTDPARPLASLDDAAQDEELVRVARTIAEAMREEG